MKGWLKRGASKAIADRRNEDAWTLQNIHTKNWKIKCNLSGHLSGYLSTSVTLGINGSGWPRMGSSELSLTRSGHTERKPAMFIHRSADHRSESAAWRNRNCSRTCTGSHGRAPCCPSRPACTDRSPRRTAAAGASRCLARVDHSARSGYPTGVSPTRPAAFRCCSSRRRSTACRSPSALGSVRYTFAGHRTLGRPAGRCVARPLVAVQHCRPSLGNYLHLTFDHLVDCTQVNYSARSSWWRWSRSAAIAPSEHWSSWAADCAPTSADHCCRHAGRSAGFFFAACRCDAGSRGFGDGSSGGRICGRQGSESLVLYRCIKIIKKNSEKDLGISGKNCGCNQLVGRVN